MPAPVVPPITELAYQDMGAWYRADVDTEDQDVLRLVAACLWDLQELEDLIRDTDDGPGWSSVVDVNRAPAAWLPWLAQFVGVTLLATDNAEAQREAIHATVNFRRGTVASMRAAAQVYLTGTKQVRFFERYQGNAYRLRVQTLLAETPDLVKVEAALRSMKPAGIVLTYAAVDGRIYLDVDTDFTDYADLLTEGTYADVLTP